MGSGQTPTENTGPSFDHTSFSKDGKKIIEVLMTTESECLRFIVFWAVCFLFSYFFFFALMLEYIIADLAKQKFALNFLFNTFIVIIIAYLIFRLLYLH